MGKTVKEGADMLLLLLAGAVFFYILQGILYRKCWNRGLDVLTEFESRAACEGDVAYLREEITNDKLLPLPALEVNLAVNRGLKFSGEAKDNANVSDQSYRRDVFSLFLRQRIIRRLSFICEKRGFYEITKTDVIGYDFFFRRNFRDICKQNTSMYVYPKPVDARRIAVLYKAVSGMVITQNRLFPDPFQFSGIRDYRPTDPMHHINWKASAKGQGLAVNQFDSTTNIRMKIILDTEDTGIWRRDGLTEEGIRIAASLASRMVKEKMELTVTGNAIRPIHLKEGTGHIEELLRELACIDIYRQTERICEVLKRERKVSLPDVMYVVISMNQDKETAAAIAAMAENGNSVLWVAPSDGSSKNRPENFRGVTAFVWEMEG